MTSSNFDAQILAAQQAKNALLKKVGIFSLAGIAGATVIYLGVSFMSGDGLSSSESLTSSEQEQSRSGNREASSNTEDILQYAREELQQKLVFAENAVADIEQDTGRNNFNSNAIKPLRNTLQLALGSYSSENYQQAGRQLEQLKVAVTQFEQDYATAWQNAWQRAQTAFAQAQQDATARISSSAFSDAQLYNQKVLHLNPGATAAQELQARLDVWQQVNRYKEELRVAEVENNLTKQLALSKDILALDPGNQEMPHKIANLQETLKQQEFNHAIVLAREALSRADIAATTAALQKARTIDSNRDEVAQLQRELDLIVKNNSIARFEQQIATMQSVDNWAAAQKLSESAKTKHPEHDKFELSLQLANQILDYQGQLNAYLATPERLADNNIHSNALRLLEEVAPLEVASRALKNRADVLRGALQDSQQTVAVTVLSDGRTDIRVLGTGVVGKTREKVIQLLPGSYRFEGRRKGYHSKILTLIVRDTTDMQSITLVCDEKI